MSVIKIHGTDRSFPAKLTTSILNTLLSNRYPIDTICGGKAQCGRDVIRIISGAQYLSPCRERERVRLDELARQGEPSGPDIRLACQTYVRGDIEIEVFHHREPGVGAPWPPRSGA